jgi:HK97 family phage portal protein
METEAEFEVRSQLLEERRADRRAQSTNAPDYLGTGVTELAPGRGNLNYNSSPYGSAPLAMTLIGNRSVSFTRLFQTQPWVAAAVMRLLTWALRVPIKCYRRTGDDPNDRKVLGPGDHPIAELLVHPWDRGNQAQLIMNLLGPILVHGNSVMTVDDTARSGRIQFDPKDWRFCQPIMPWRGSLEGFRCDVDSAQYARDFSIDKVLHCAWWSPAGPLGTSPLMQLGVTMQVEDAAQRYQRSLFAYGGRPPTAVIASEAFLGIKEPERKKIMAQLRADLNDLYGGPENSGKPALLPPGLDWKPVGQTTVEAALTDQRKVAREEVCAVYLIPPPMLGILERATFSNIQVQREMVYTECLGPPLVLLEQALNAQVIRDLLQENDVFVEFDFSAVLRGDRLSEITALRDAIASALLSPNEGRNVLNLPSITDGRMDEFYLPTNNLTSITSDQDPALQPPAPPAAGPPAPVPPTNTPPKPPLNAPKQPPGALYVVSGGREYLLEPV